MEKARKKSKDLVVLIDMDLEGYDVELILPPDDNGWPASVKWAGRMANLVSEAFKEQNPLGVRLLCAHSAGGDATNQSVYQSVKQGNKKPLYDYLYVMNGRTKASNFKKNLLNNGYQPWQVKVFTNKGDLPATPDLPFIGSLSNYDTARALSGKAWVHLHSYDLCGHPGIRDALSTALKGNFAVQFGSKEFRCVKGPVKEVMLKDFRLKPKLVSKVACKGILSKCLKIPK